MDIASWHVRMYAMHSEIVGNRARYQARDTRMLSGVARARNYFSIRPPPLQHTADSIAATANRACHMQRHRARTDKIVCKDLAFTSASSFCWELTRRVLAIDV